MWSNKRIGIILAISGACAAAGLGLVTKPVLDVLAPGMESGLRFTAAPVDKHVVVRCGIDCGSTKALLAVKVAGDAVAVAKAALAKGPNGPLRVDPDPDLGPGWIRIAGGPPRPKPAEKFDWASGLPVELRLPADAVGGDPFVHDWKLFSAKDGEKHDSASQAGRRSIVRWSAVLLGLLAVAGTGVSTYHAIRSKQHGTAEEPFLLWLVRTHEAADPSQTDRVRRVLTRVLKDGTPLVVALQEEGVDAGTTRGRQYLFKLVAEVRARLLAIETDVGGYERQLDPWGEGDDADP